MHHQAGVNFENWSEIPGQFANRDRRLNRDVW